MIHTTFLTALTKWQRVTFNHVLGHWTPCSTMVCRHQKNEWINPKLPWANIYSKGIFNHPSNFNLKTCIHDDFTLFMSCLGTDGVRTLGYLVYNALVWHDPAYIDKKRSLFWVETWTSGVLFFCNFPHQLLQVKHTVHNNLNPPAATNRASHIIPPIPVH